MTDMIKLTIIALCCVLLCGCFSIEVQWNKIRVGVLEYDKRVQGSDYVTRESTFGFQLNWAPDVDLSGLMNDESTVSSENK